MSSDPDMSAPGPRPGSHLSRRALLTGGVGLAVLTACGSKGGSGTTGPSASTDTGADQAALLPFFIQNDFLTVGSQQRGCFGVGDSSGALLDDTPAELQFTVTPERGKAIETTVKRHNAGLPRAYYPLEFTPEVTGLHTVTTTYKGQKLDSQFSVGAAGANPVPGPGTPMPSLVTPTVADHQGLDPICTRDPVCPLHDVSLDAALGQGRPVAFLVSTPKFCTTAICGPVLDVLLGETGPYAGKVTFIHQEVYRSATDAAEHGNAAALAPAVEALALTYEPVLFLVGADGKVARRLDVIYDAGELKASLEALVA